MIVRCLRKTTQQFSIAKNRADVIHEALVDLFKRWKKTSRMEPKQELLFLCYRSNQQNWKIAKLWNTIIKV